MALLKSQRFVAWRDSSKPWLAIIFAVTIAWPTLGRAAEGVHFKEITNQTETFIPTAVAAGDFNGDGVPDLAIASTGSKSVVIALGDGTGHFAVAHAYEFDGPVVSVVAGDFNRDGNLDLAVADTNGNAVAILLGNGDGSFAPGGKYAVDIAPAAIIVSDFNHDGIPDLAVADSGSNDISILLGVGDGTFQAHRENPAHLHPFGLAAGDFNADGNIDLVCTNIDSADASVFLGRGDGSFQTKHKLDVGNSPTSVAVGDFNRDGHLDLAVTNSADNTISILLGDGGGGFTPGTPAVAGTTPYSVVVADFNNDGIPDLAVANSGSNDVSILLGNGDGTFSAPLDFPVGLAPQFLLALDMNLDHRSDLAVADTGIASITSLVNASPTTSEGPSPSFDPDDALTTGSGIDSIDPYTGQLGLMIPIGPVYKVTPQLQFQLSMRYSSRIWAQGMWPTGCTAPDMLLQGDKAIGPGWYLSLGNIVESQYQGTPVAYVDANGSAHQLFPSRFDDETADGKFYTRDGSYLRVEWVSSTAGYVLRMPNGTVVTLGHQVTGFDDPPAAFQTDFGRGRNGWHATAITEPHGNSITVAYQSNSNYAWIPYQISIPSIGGSSRTITINMSGSQIGTIQVPVFTGSTVYYTLGYSTPQNIARPTGCPPVAASSVQLTSISLPDAGYSSAYTFTYWSSNPAPQSPYGVGTMKSQTIPQGATINYDYGTWTFYHENPVNYASSCPYPQTPLDSRPLLITGPGYESPSIPALGTCGGPDIAGGVVSRQLSYSTPGGGVYATTKYYQYDFPKGEADNTLAQTETLMVSPPDAQGNVHSTSYLFATASSPTGYSNATAGPLTGALLRKATFATDESNTSTFIATTSHASRVESFTYETDALSTVYFAAPANRRVTQTVTTYHMVDSSHPIQSGYYHQVDYTFDPSSGHYSDEKHSGTVGNDARELTTTWSPNTTSWLLDLPTSMVLKNGSYATFATTTNTINSFGVITQSSIVDSSGQGSGTLTHAITESNGFPSSETFTLGSLSYTKNNIAYVSGTLASGNWGSLPWKFADNSIDGSTGLVATARDANSTLSTSYTYDAFGRPLTVTPAGNDAVTTISYDNNGPDNGIEATTIQRDSDGNELAWSQSVLDQVGRISSRKKKIAGGGVATVTYHYDSQGNTAAISEWVADGTSSPPATQYSNFDEFGRPTTVTTADGQVTAINFIDSSCNPACNSIWKKAVTQTVSGASSTTVYNMDAFGNITKVTDGLGNVVTYVYNVQDRMTSATQGSESRAFGYDGFGFLRTATLPEVGNNTIRYTYDPFGNVATKTDGDGTTITYAHDSAGRVKSLVSGLMYYQTYCYDGTGTCADGTPNSSGGIYPAGRLTRSIGRNPSAPSAVKVTEDRVYSEAAGRMSEEETTYDSGSLSGSTLVAQWSYTPLGLVNFYSHPRRAASADAPFVVGYQYDHGLATAVYANGLPVVTSATYEPSGLLAGYTSGNAVITTIAEDASGMARPGRISTTGATGGSNLDTGMFTYDGAGNITAMGPADSFTYDATSRITKATYGTQNESFTYDQYGNLIGNGGLTYTVNTYNHVTASTGVAGAFTYDNRGNLTQAGTSEGLTFDSINRLAKAVESSLTYGYVYDAAGMRVLATPPTGSWRYEFHDPAGRLAAEYLGTAPLRDNVFLGNLLVGSFADCNNDTYTPGWIFYITDHLGSPRLVTDENGVVVDSPKYWPYGTRTTTQTDSSGQPVGFAGLARDWEATRSYANARYYDFSRVGRFLSLDPRTGAAQVPISWNRYAYAAANPLRFTDPAGSDLMTDALETMQAMAGPDADKICIEDGYVVVSDYTDEDLAANPGLALEVNLANSDYTYSYTENDFVDTAAGLVLIARSWGVANLDNTPDPIGHGKGSADLPPAGIDDSVVVRPDTCSVDALTLSLAVSLPATAFHELDEAYYKVDFGIPRGGIIDPTSFGAHMLAMADELALEQGRQGFTQFPAGGVLKTLP